MDLADHYTILASKTAFSRYTRVIILIRNPVTLSTPSSVAGTAHDKDKLEILEISVQPRMRLAMRSSVV